VNAAGDACVCPAGEYMDDSDVCTECSDETVDDSTTDNVCDCVDTDSTFDSTTGVCTCADENAEFDAANSACSCIAGYFVDDADEC